MTKKQPKSPADYIQPLNINGMEGRMLHMPALKKPSNKEILFVYGHHSSLERWWGLAQTLNHSAAVTMPDLPGFGGMDSFYKIGKKPSIDNLADYLAAFVKLRYKRKKIILVAMSFGFVVATRMLQRYPELTKKVSLLVSIVGFAHRDDFTFSRSRYNMYLTVTRIFCHRPFSTIFRYVGLNRHVLHAVYARTHNAKHKFASANTRDEFNYLMEVEVGLWQNNEARTYMYTSREFLQLDNCRVRVDLPVWHVSSSGDRYFDNNVVEQHLRVIFSDYHNIETAQGVHAPSIIADEKMAAPFVPAKLRKILSAAA